MMRRLAVLQQRAEKLVHRLQLQFADVGAGSGFAQNGFVLLLSKLMQIEPLVQYTLVLVFASVANIRRYRQARAKLFLEIHTDGIAAVAGAAIQLMPRIGAGELRTEIRLRAGVAVYAAILDPSRGSFVALNGMALDLPGNRCATLPKQLRDIPQ